MCQQPRLRSLVVVVILFGAVVSRAAGASGAQACTRGWAVVPSPSPGVLGSQLEDVSVVSATDAWAVGVAGGSPSRTVAEHWDGTEWTVVPTVDVGSLN